MAPYWYRSYHCSKTCSTWYLSKGCLLLWNFLNACLIKRLALWGYVKTSYWTGDFNFHQVWRVFSTCLAINVSLSFGYNLQSTESLNQEIWSYIILILFLQPVGLIYTSLNLTPFQWVTPSHPPGSHGRWGQQNPSCWRVVCKEWSSVGKGLCADQLITTATPPYCSCQPKWVWASTRDLKLCFTSKKLRPSYCISAHSKPSSAYICSPVICPISTY